MSSQGGGEVKVQSESRLYFRFRVSATKSQLVILASAAPDRIKGLRWSLFNHLCRSVSSSSGGLTSARESLCRGLGSRGFTERFYANAPVTHFQHGKFFCTARSLENYAVALCRLHQRAPQR